MLYLLVSSLQIVLSLGCFFIDFFNNQETFYLCLLEPGLLVGVESVLYHL